MRVIIDKRQCQGLGMCEVEAPEFFEVADDGHSALLREPEEFDRRLMEAAESGCPVHAISISDE